MKLLIRNTKPDDWILAVRAATRFLTTERHDSIIVSYENKTSFWVKKTKAGNLSISGEYTL